MPWARCCLTWCSGCLGQITRSDDTGGRRLLYLESSVYASSGSRLSRLLLIRYSTAAPVHVQLRMDCRPRPSRRVYAPHRSKSTKPLHHWCSGRKEYAVDSGGAGEYRGGLGQRIDLTHRGGEGFVISKMFDRIAYPARGQSGGAAGAMGQVYAESSSDGSPTKRILSAKGRDEIAPGERLVLITPGGGGIGEVRNRTADALQLDKENGLTT